MPDFAICQGFDGKQPPHSPLQLQAWTNYMELPVLAEQDASGYSLTRRYIDGTVGVSREDRAEADIDEQPWCMDCLCEIHHWEHR